MYSFFTNRGDWWVYHNHFLSTRLVEEDDREKSYWLCDYFFSRWDTCCTRTMAPPDCQALLLQACMEQGEHVRAWKALCLTESLSLVDITITSSEIVCVCVCVSHSVMSDSYNPRDCSPLLSSVHRILQARILEWVAISFRRRSSQRDFPNPGIKPRSPALQVDYLPPEPPGKPFRNTATCYECCCFFSYWWLSTSFQFSKTSSTGLLHITYLQFLTESQLEKWRF